MALPIPSRSIPSEPHKLFSLKSSINTPKKNELSLKIKGQLTVLFPKSQESEQNDHLNYWENVILRLQNKIPSEENIEKYLKIMKVFIEKMPDTSATFTPEQMAQELIVAEFAQNTNMRILEYSIDNLSKSLEEGFPATPEALKQFDHIHKMITHLPKSKAVEWTQKYNKLVNEARLKQLAQNNEFLRGSWMENHFLEKLFKGLDEKFDPSQSLIPSREFVINYGKKNDLSLLSPEEFQKKIESDLYDHRIDLRIAASPIKLSICEDAKERIKELINLNANKLKQLKEKKNLHQQIEEIEKTLHLLNPVFEKFQNPLIIQMRGELDEFYKEIPSLDGSVFVFLQTLSDSKHFKDDKKSCIDSIEKTYKEAELNFQSFLVDVKESAMHHVNILNKYADSLALPYIQGYGHHQGGVCLAKCFEWIHALLEDYGEKISSEEEYRSFFSTKGSTDSERLEMSDITSKTRFHQALYEEQQIANENLKSYTTLLKEHHLDLQENKKKASLDECLNEMMIAFDSEKTEVAHFILTINPEDDVEDDIGEGHAVALEINTVENIFVFRDPNIGWFNFSSPKELQEAVKDIVETFYPDLPISSLYHIIQENPYKEAA